MKLVIHNIQSKAYNKENVFILCIIDNDDIEIKEEVKIIVKENKQVDLYINEDESLGYYGLATMFSSATKYVSTDLIALWGDRVYIDTQNYDRIIMNSFNSANPFSFFQLNEHNTWEYAYPLVSTNLNSKVNVFKTEAPDAYIRYIAECCNNNIFIQEVHITRKNPTQENIYSTTMSTKRSKESLFRQSIHHKKSILDDINQILKYNEVNYNIPNNRCDAWLKTQIIGNGPPIISTKKPPIT